MNTEVLMNMVVMILLIQSRQRYKITLGFKTKIADNWFTDIALAMGSKGRSDNATLGSGGFQNRKKNYLLNVQC